ncbi:conserved Plasmodium protein, unknown function [Plasmodium ovale curtisi]|uniref:START domain-containing protein n=1 Tax=Plasmodium ovale curtisi TaxID=864141 RepID=A0A1A8VMU3_PLAOA|nr:conserved Plasmodium protein, unknown function [Plasmodium ovale curtisi]
MPKLSYLIRKCKGRENEKINESHRVNNKGETEIFSVLNEDSCRSSESICTSSHIETSWDTIAPLSDAQRECYTSNLNESNASTVSYLNILNDNLKEEYKIANEEISSDEKKWNESFVKLDVRDSSCSIEKDEKEKKKKDPLDGNEKKNNEPSKGTIEQGMHNLLEKSINNILLSKKSHMFHSIKILMPIYEEMDVHNVSEGSINLNVVDDIDCPIYVTRGYNEQDMKNEITHTTVTEKCKDGISISKPFCEIYEGNTNCKKNPMVEKGIEIQRIRVNPLNNVYTNFVMYENKIKKIEKNNRKEKIESDDKHDVLFAQNKLLKDISTIEKHVYISQLYNDILEGINYFNKLKVRQAYHCIRKTFLKKYCNDQKRRKNFLENTFVSEILYRYKIIKKIEVLFNLDVNESRDDMMKYSIILKRVYRNFLFDYIIDLVDVNGKMCLEKYVNWLRGGTCEDANRSEHTKGGYSEYVKSHTTVAADNPDSNEILRKHTLACGQSMRDKEGYAESEKAGEEVLERKNKKLVIRKKKHIMNKESKRKGIYDNFIPNKYIDFRHFHLAYQEEGSEVFYFVAKKELNPFKRGNNNSSAIWRGLRSEEATEAEESSEGVEETDNGNTGERSVKLRSKTRIKKVGTNKYAHNNMRAISGNDISDGKEEKNDISTEENCVGSDATTVTQKRGVITALQLSHVSMYIYVCMYVRARHGEWPVSYTCNHFAKCRFGISECKTLKERGMIDKIVYTKIAMPWIVRDRYLLMDLWICEDFECSKGIFLYASNFPKSSENSKDVPFGTDGCVEIDMTIHAFILPRNWSETVVKCYVEISPNANLNEMFITFLTKVFIKSCISHFAKACKNFEVSEEYNCEIKKNHVFYDHLRAAAEDSNIYQQQQEQEGVNAYIVIRTGAKTSPSPRLGITAYKRWHAHEGVAFFFSKQRRCGKCGMANVVTSRHNANLVHLCGASAFLHSIISYFPFGMPFCVEGFMQGRIYAEISLAILPLLFCCFRSA